MLSDPSALRRDDDDDNNSVRGCDSRSNTNLLVPAQKHLSSEFN